MAKKMNIRLDSDLGRDLMTVTLSDVADIVRACRNYMDADEVKHASDIAHGIGDEVVIRTRELLDTEGPAFAMAVAGQAALDQVASLIMFVDEAIALDQLERELEDM